jgi:hypothetical protein
MGENTTPSMPSAEKEKWRDLNGEFGGSGLHGYCLCGLCSGSQHRRIGACGSSGRTDAELGCIQCNRLWSYWNCEPRNSVRHYRNNLLTASACSVFNSWCCDYNRAAHGSFPRREEGVDINGLSRRSRIYGDSLRGIRRGGCDRRAGIGGSANLAIHDHLRELHNEHELLLDSLQCNGIWADGGNQSCHTILVLSNHKTNVNWHDWNHPRGGYHNRPPHGCVPVFQEGISHTRAASPLFLFFTPLIRRWSVERNDSSPRDRVRREITVVGFRMKKKFILALQPHEAFPTHRAWSPGRSLHTLSFCAVMLLLLMGLAFPINGTNTINTTKIMTKPDIWQEQVRIGLLRISYGWQNTPLLPSKDATALYSQWFSKAPKNGCSDALERDWKMVCPLISSQMSNNLDCANANKESKAQILKNFESSKTTAQYACLYGN